MYRLTSKLTTNPINQSGLIAGAIGGESIVLVVLVNTLLIRAFAQGNLPPTDMKVVAWNATYPFLIIAIFEGWGVFAAWLSFSSIRNRNEAFLAGFISGVMIGILLEVMWVAQLLSLLSHQLIPYSGTIAGYGNVLVTVAALILFVLLGGILSGFGSYIFYLFRASPVDRSPA
ncbi:hypothetical protein Mboo_2403 [Methanoregula boonei 6A8]|uniref:Uncharacterized protein n=1 Tax=Methanoregula boonei (strain DSM 21154 / JCM 14090 / 6A8) TaxID=456442 RepID=A7IB06_METB6|nr:hypothetical protein [Methanoregula boonei]ABS56917.1 hypothetical protein Mboo_2403 [Methanoregula boonei 6A8]